MTIPAAADMVFVRREPAQKLLPPVTQVGAIGWARANLFSSIRSTILTLVMAVAAVWIINDVLHFLIIDAVWSGTDREACLPRDGQEVGACWAFIHERLSFFIYGSYPAAGRWRVDVFFLLLAVSGGWMLWLDAPRRDIGAIVFFVALPLVSFVLLSGWPLIGLPTVETDLWGGMLVTVLVATVGIVVSLPVGILLALGRRSDMPAVRFLSITFIEFVRGVPLITVLFMASVMLPLFVPPEFSPDKLLRALVGMVIFASAYQAEVVRAGLEGIPRGQFEAAKALGLGYWKLHTFIILPQALRITIPNIVNSFIALFKDTSLVFFVGIFDFLKTIEIARLDPKWSGPNISLTGYAFAAIVYFICCSLMASYAASVERRLERSDRR